MCYEAASFCGQGQVLIVFLRNLDKLLKIFVSSIRTLMLILGRLERTETSLILFMWEVT